MRHAVPLCAALVVAVGCRGTGSRTDVCPPDPCPAPAAACAPKADVQCQDEVVVKAPRQKVVVETPPACVQPAACAQPAVPQAMASGLPMTAAAPQMSYGVPFAQNGVAMAGEVRDRTGLGFVFDTIKIPIPVIRPIAVQRPAEVTFRTQIPQQSGTSMGFGLPVATMPVAGMSMGAVPMTGMSLGAVPMTGMSMGAMPVNGMSMGLVPQPAIGLGQVTVQGQLSGVQAAQLQATLAQAGVTGQGQLTPQQQALIQAILAQGGGAQGAPNPAAAQGAGGDSAAALKERLNATEAELKRLEELCEQVKKIRQSQATEKKTSP